MHKVLNGHPYQYYELVRMEKHMFHYLCHDLKRGNLFKDSKIVPAEEQVVLFLMIIGHSVRNRIVAYDFIIR